MGEFFYNLPNATIDVDRYCHVILTFTAKNYRLQVHQRLTRSSWIGEIRLKVELPFVKVIFREAHLEKRLSILSSSRRQCVEGLFGFEETTSAVSRLRHPS